MAVTETQYEANVKTLKKSKREQSLQQCEVTEKSSVSLFFHNLVLMFPFKCPRNMLIFTLSAETTHAVRILLRAFTLTEGALFCQLLALNKTRAFTVLDSEWQRETF